MLRVLLLIRDSQEHIVVVGSDRCIDLMVTSLPCAKVVVIPSHLDRLAVHCGACQH